MSSSTARPRSGSPDKRFAITVTLSQGASIRVSDRSSQHTLFDWSGPVAAHLIQSGVLAVQPTPVQTHYCDKGFVQHLSLLAASAQLVHDTPTRPAPSVPPDRHRTTIIEMPTEPRWSRLASRLRRLDAALGKDDMTVAKLLFSKPGQHFSTDDVACLLTLRDRPLPSHRVDASLGRLTALEVIQRIDVAPGRVFYDIDTRPHLHLYDEKTGELHDAEVDGVIGTEENKPAAELRIMDGNRVRILPSV